MYNKTRKQGEVSESCLKLGESRCGCQAVASTRQTEPLASVQCYFSYQLFLFRGHCLSRNFFWLCVQEVQFTSARIFIVV